MLTAVVAGIVPAAAGSAGGNALTFRFDTCKPGGVDCTPYANTDARIMDLSTGVETYVVNDANGWVTFGHLEDGSYAFSTPAVQQESITTSCTDAYGVPVASWMGENGPTVTLSNYASVTCVGQMIPKGSGGAPDGPTNSLTFRSIICPEGADICTPYSPADARFMPLATGVETFGAAGAEGWSEYPGLADGEYAFSNPSVAQKSSSVLCTDATDATVPSWEGWAGPTVALAGGIDVTCTITLVPFGPGAPTDTSGSVEPSASASATPDSLPVSVSITILECPAGYAGSDYSADCGNPVDASRYTGKLAWGTIPNNFHVLDAAFNDYGHAAFDGLEPDTYSVHAASTSATLVSVACEVFAGINDEGTRISPSLGSAGYEVTVGVDGAANCYFSMIPTGTSTVPEEETPADDVPAEDSAADEAPVVDSTTDEAPVVDSQAPADAGTVSVEQDAPVAGGVAAAPADATTGTSAAAPTRLPNTGSGARGTELDLTNWIIATVIGAVLTVGAGTVVGRAGRS
jgi:hypothetical protein